MQNKKSSNLFMWISFVIMTAIIIGGMGLYLFIIFQQGTLSKVGKNYTVATPTINKTTAITTDETTNWKNYSNSTDGYSIKYPSDWLIDKSYINDGTLYILTKERKNKLDSGDIGTRVFDVMVKVYSSSSKLPNNQGDQFGFNDWVTKKSADYGLTNKSATTINSISGYRWLSGETGGLVAMIEKGGKIYHFETAEKSTSEQEQIISTFKITQ